MTTIAQPALATATTSADRSAIPWYLWAVAFASTSVIVGVIWDISWHRTIGRDTFWTPAHLAIYLGGAVAGLSCGWLVLKTTFAGTEAAWAGRVTFWGFRGPLGAWVCIWGSLAMVVGGLVLGLVVWGGWTWWDDVDQAYRSRIYRPLDTSSDVAGSGSERVLTLTVDDPTWLGRNWTPLMPDHGKLMHMFLVGDGDLSTFAHIHPTSADSRSFEVLFPPLPAGDYRIYADVVYESGFAETLIGTVSAPADSAEPHTDRSPARDVDDSWAELRPLGESRDDVYRLPSGRQMHWEQEGASVADQETTLRFSLADVDGAPARLEPYMGMLSHAAVSRDDGSVFVHLHPSGSINLAAQMRFEREEGDGASRGMAGRHDREAIEPTNTVSFSLRLS